MQINPNPIFALNKKALSLYRLQQYDKALEKLDEAISKDSNNSGAYNLKCLALMNSNRYPEALSAFDKSIEIDSRYLAPLINKGILFMKIQKYNEAIDSFNRALQINPVNQFALDAKNTAMNLLKRYSSWSMVYNRWRNKRQKWKNNILGAYWFCPILQIRRQFRCILPYVSE